MLTQVPIPDPTCKLNISSFHTLPHLWDQEFCVHCVVIMNDGETGWVGVVGWVWLGRQGLGVIP